MSSAAVIDAPVFRNTRHALHVSFLVMSQPPKTISPTAVVIDMLVKQNFVWDGLEPERSSSVNFSGLSPLEVRAQCAQVVAMANHLPNRAYSDALAAIYGHQAIKSEGVRGVARYAEAMMPHLGADTVLYVAWHVFATQRQRDAGVTLAEIAKHHGVTLDATRHASSRIRTVGRTLHGWATSALAQRFVDGGLCEEA
jgi:hypothetical protein